MGEKKNNDLPKGVGRIRKRFRQSVKIDGKWTYRMLKARTVEQVWQEVGESASATRGTVAFGCAAYKDWCLKRKKANGKPYYSAQTLGSEKGTAWYEVSAIEKEWGDIRFEDIETDKVLQWGHENNAWRKIMRFQTMWTAWVKYLKLVPRTMPNPFYLFPFPDGVKGGARERYVTDRELETCVKVCWDLYHLKKTTYAGGPKRFPTALETWGFLHLMYLTGRRVSSIVNLEWSHLKEDGIHFVEAKTGKRSVVLWNEELQKTITFMKDNCRKSKPFNRFVFPSTNASEKSRHTNQNHRLIRLRPHFRAAGVPDFQLRDLRGKFGSDHNEGRDMLLHTSKKVFDDHYLRVPAEVTPLGVATRKPNTRNR